MSLIELIELSKLRSKILIVTIRATTICQAIAFNTRHNHYIVWLSWKVTVMMLLWNSRMEWRLYIVFKDCRRWRILNLWIRYAFQCLCTRGLKMTLLKYRVRLISNRDVLLISFSWSLLPRLSNTWIVLFLSIYKWILNLLSCSSICSVEICSLRPRPYLILCIHQSLLRWGSVNSYLSERSLIRNLLLLKNLVKFGFLSDLLYLFRLLRRAYC